jgi:hypothetical protein
MNNESYIHIRPSVRPLRIHSLIHVLGSTSKLEEMAVDLWPSRRTRKFELIKVGFCVLWAEALLSPLLSLILRDFTCYLTVLSNRYSLYYRGMILYFYKPHPSPAPLPWETPTECWDNFGKSWKSWNPKTGQSKSTTNQKRPNFISRFSCSVRIIYYARRQ